MFFIVLMGSIMLFQAFFVWKAVEFFGRDRVMVWFCVILISCIGVASIFLSRYLESNSDYRKARIFTYIGYMWLTFSFLFFMWGIPVEVISFFAGINIKLRFLIPLVIAIFSILYGYFEACHIRTENITIYSDKIAPEDTLVIAQITDVHLDLLLSESYMEEFLNTLENTEADILVNTGDFIDGHTFHEKHIIERLSVLEYRFGKLFVTGNHEYYHDFDHSIEFTDSSGFTRLSGDSYEVSDSFVFYGVDDHTGRRMGKQYRDETSIKYVDSKKYNILLKHEPLIAGDTPDRFDLQLSGHTHNGQVFPFNLFTRMRYKYNHGLHKIDDFNIYISRGTGTWGPPIRFLSPPEITVITLKAGIRG